jgi:hypothetical protein
MSPSLDLALYVEFEIMRIFSEATENLYFLKDFFFIKGYSKMSESSWEH